MERDLCLKNESLIRQLLTHPVAEGDTISFYYRNSLLVRNVLSRKDLLKETLDTINGRTASDQIVTAVIKKKERINRDYSYMSSFCYDDILTDLRTDDPTEHILYNENTYTTLPTQEVERTRGHRANSLHFDEDAWRYENTVQAVLPDRTGAHMVTTDDTNTSRALETIVGRMRADVTDHWSVPVTNNVDITVSSSGDLQGVAPVTRDTTDYYGTFDGQFIYTSPTQDTAINRRATLILDRRETPTITFSNNRTLELAQEMDQLEARRASIDTTQTRTFMTPPRHSGSSFVRATYDDLRHSLFDDNNI